MYSNNKYPVISTNVNLTVITNKKEPEGFFGEVIYSYTRQDAINDGLLVSLDNLGDEVIKLSKEHYKYPIALTRSVYDIVEKAVNNKKWLNCLTGVLHDILHMRGWRKE